MANTTVTITQLPPIGNAFTPSSILPVVQTTGIVSTDQASLGNLGNYILTQAGANLQPAYVANFAYAVTNAAQPMITSVGTLSVNTLRISGGVNGQFLQTNGNGLLNWAIPAGGTVTNYPGGANSQLQFNLNGSFGGNANLTWVNGNIVTTGIKTDGYFFANGVPFNGGSGSTGNIAFSGTTMSGPTGSADNYSVYIKPSGDFINTLQILPTADNDIHLFEATGNAITLGSYGESQVSVNGPGSPNANITIQSNNNTWTFSGDGVLQVPSNATAAGPGTIAAANGYPTLLAYGNSGGFGIHGGPELDWMNANDPANSFGNNTVLRNTMFINGGGLYIGMNENGVANVPTAVWRFKPDGTTIFPTLTTQRGDNPSGTITGQTLLFGDNEQEAIISTPDGVAGINGDSSQRLVINPGEGYQGGEGGDIYLWAGRGGNASGSGGDIKIRGGQGGANTVGGAGGAGGYIRMEAGDAATTGGNPGYIDITGGYSNTVGGYVNVTGGQGATVGGDVKIYGGYGTATGGNVNIWGGASGNGQINEGSVNIQTGGKTWTYDASGNLTLPSNTFAVNYANGTQVSIGGSGNTGNVTFSDQVVVGTGDIYGGSGLFLAPGTNSVANLQYLRVRGGDYPTHIHFDTGNNQYYDQYFGADSKFVKLEANGNIVINADDYAGNGAFWTFGADGNLKLPGVLLAQASDNGSIVFSNNGVDNNGSLKVDAGFNMTINANSNFYVKQNSSDRLAITNTNTDLMASSNVNIHANKAGLESVWTFGVTGNLTIPGDINLPLVAKLNSGGVGVTNSAEFGTDVTVDGSNVINGSSIYMGAGTAESRAIVNSTGNSLMYTGVENPGFAGTVAVDPGVTSEYAIQVGANGQIEIGAVVGAITTTEYVAGMGVLNATGNINGIFANANVAVIGAGDQGWTFNANGTLAAPGAINLPGSITWPGASAIFEDSGLVLQGATGLAITSPGTTQITAGSNSWLFTNDGNLTIPGGGAVWTLGTGTSGLTANFADPYKVNLGLDYTTNTATLAGANSVYIQSNIGANTNQWAFSTDGSLTLPNGAVIKDTAGNAVAVGAGAGANQGNQSVAIGENAGANQGSTAVAIGQNAGGGVTYQNDDAVAIGHSAGEDGQGTQAIAIGLYTGQVAQGLNSIALGAYAGVTSQGNNSIILNATGVALDQTTANTFTVAPVRNDVANISEVMFYNTTSKEVTYGNSISIAGNINAGNIITGTGTTGNITGANVISANTFQSTVVAFNQLPPATTPGLRAFINNGNLAAVGNFGVQVGDGGANYVPVFSDGANWCIG